MILRFRHGQRHPRLAGSCSLGLEQLFFLHPLPGWAEYRTPIKNLYMCGSATHPGGGIMVRPAGWRRWRF
jgi:phytoene dehydrogenase-like protein